MKGDTALTTLLAAEFQFVQQYIFALPKLRAMVGANRSLALALKALEKAVPSVLSYPLPQALRDHFDKLAAFERTYLGERAEGDKPAEQLERGILAAAGGHFEVLLDSGDEALSENMVRALHEYAPGLAFSLVPADVDAKAAFHSQDGAVRRAIGQQKFERSKGAAALFGHPYMQVCQYSGTEPADHKQSYWPEPPRYVSQRTKMLLELGHTTTPPPVSDMAGFVEDRVLSHHKGARLPREFNEFLHPGEGRSFLAIVAIDGNNVGQSLKQFQQTKIDKGATYFEGAAQTELFFYRLRLLHRVALVRALLATKSLSPIARESENKGEGSEQVLPLRMLMLGGDDALLVLRPYVAMEFIQHFARWWHALLCADQRLAGDEVQFSEEEWQGLTGWTKQFGAFTFKAGIALTPASYPFHAGHALAYELASSAKSARLPDGSGTSTVDWHMLFSSQPEPLDQLRAREYTRSYTLGVEQESLHLTHRPYPILGTGKSLEAQWSKASSLAQGIAEEEQGRIARSKLKLLRTLVGIGRLETELILRELRQATRGAAGLPEKAFEKVNGAYETELMDLAELVDMFVEKQRLEKVRAAEKEEQEVPAPS
jgi:hypothetical protein